MNVRSLVLASTIALSLGTSGCIKKMLLNGQIQSTREAAPALDTVGDYEMALRAASAGLAQFEGMHRLAPDNEDALFLLVKGWTGFGYAFIEDEAEDAHDRGNDDLAAYHTLRAKNAYDRAITYGVELLQKKAGGFSAATKDEDAMKAWLSAFKDPEDAPNLFWTGYAWMARTNLMKENLEYVAKLFVGVKLVEKSVELDSNYNFSTGTVALAAYHARSQMAEMDEAKRLFEGLLQKTQRKTLAVQFNYASRYFCAKADRANYEKLLAEVLAADNPDPKQRLTNAVMKRRAARWNGKKRKEEMCGIYPP